MELLLLMLVLSSFKGGALKPGMTGLMNVPVPPVPGSSPGAQAVKQIGMVCVKLANGRLGWTNVLPAENARSRTFGNGSRVVIKSGTKQFHAKRDGDGPQGGAFFVAT